MRLSAGVTRRQCRHRLTPRHDSRSRGSPGWLTDAPPIEPAAPPADRYDFAGREIDFAALELRRGGRTLALTLMEANLLRYLVQREGQVVSRKDILEQVWGVHEDTDTRAIDNFVVRLRRYIEDDAATPRHLLTVRSVGYRFAIVAA